MERASKAAAGAGRRFFDASELRERLAGRAVERLRPVALQGVEAVVVVGQQQERAVGHRDRPADDAVALPHGARRLVAADHVEHRDGAAVGLHHHVHGGVVADRAQIQVIDLAGIAELPQARIAGESVTSAETIVMEATAEYIARQMSAKVEPVVSDTLIAFAAKAGSVALDGDNSNSPFTTAFLKFIAQPRVEVRLLGSGLPSIWIAHMGDMQPAILEEILSGLDEFLETVK